MTTKVAVIVLVCALVALVAAAAPQGDPKTFYYDQKLDHFHGAVNAPTWKQKYQVTGDWYKPGGPVFLFLSGEAPMEFFAFQTVQIRNWAQKMNAMYVNLEHRFYGDSNPLPAPFYSNDNLGYLSSQQALADAAEFIQWYRGTLDAPGPLVVFGCSYSAGLASWFRLLYPDIAVGSVAPSGPVQATLNYTSFFGEFSNSAAPQCVGDATKASAQIQALSQTEQGRQQLSEAFNACEPLSEENVYYFLWTLMGAVGSADQMNNPPTWILNTTCDLLHNNTNGLLAGFAAAFEFNQNQADGLTSTKMTTMRRPVPSVRDQVRGCNSFDEAQMLASLVEPDNPNRSWWWQKCVEFGYFKPGYAGTSPFFSNLPVEHIVAYCAKIFGVPDMTPHIEYTNTYYGAKKLNATNVVFTNGILDPWHLLSVFEDEGSVKAYNYEAGHCGTLIEATDQDPPSLVSTRQAVEEFLQQVVAA